MIDVIEIKKAIKDKEIEFYIGGNRIYCRSDNGDTIQVLDLSEHDKRVRAEFIEEIKKNLPQTFCNNCNQIACDGGRVGSIQECASVSLLIDVLGELEDE